MVTCPMPFAYGLSFAVVWAGCGARMVGWRLSCWSASRRWSTEPRLCFALTVNSSSGRYRYRPQEKLRSVLGADWAGSGGRTFGWRMSSCCPSRRRSSESLLCLCPDSGFFLVDSNATVYKKPGAVYLGRYRFRLFR